ncbi:dTDP-4-dehydrorhamnose reductase [Corynebacterium occultum]|uniref:dTDP-4-dehydrorhamnose reductase n=1 Tax=Corynebacterium occultum TaxID=2675219 RepID=A0A6B8W6T9_9CORY|nr:dTDP-4-dehydrorhamnose reductase [Corynebacterium occultum]QGU06616.1 dTDP-4-dehydrorhamnose reductase [Corynebacterium occultum]
MRVAITGAGGQLGSAMRLTTPPEVEAIWLGRADLDITDPEAVAHTASLKGIDVLINTAAYTAVDAAEDDEAAALLLNGEAPGHLAERCREEGAHLVQLSTDYVFGPGVPHRPLTPADPTNPDTVYGRSKLRGEQLAGENSTILRTAWVYSANTLPEHRDFVSTMLRLEKTHETVTVVADQHGCPTYAIDLARAVWEAAQQQPGVVQHAVGEGQTTWFELAQAIFAEIGADPRRITPVTSAEYPARAPRPEWSVLASDYALPEWRSALRRALAAKL